MLVVEMDVFPGPGTYDWKYPQLTPSRLSMGLLIKTSTNDGPSPNAYDIKDGIGTSARYRQSVPAWGVRSRSFYGSCYYEPIKAAVPGIALLASINFTDITVL